MKNSIRTIVPAALVGLLVGCAEEPLPKMTIDGCGPDPRQEYRRRADAFIQNYVPAEDAQPVEYAPERRESEDYVASSAAVRNMYETISLFRSAQKWESVSLEYQSAGKDVFLLNAERSGAKLRLESKDSSGGILFAAEAEIPEVVQMPGNIPAEMEESVSREMNMIFQFLMNPLRPARTVSLKTQSAVNVKEKKLQDVPQEFLVGDCFCKRLEVVLKELYGGGLLYLYVSADPKHDIRRVDFADLVLMTGNHGAFTLTFPSYEDLNGLSLPGTVVFNGVEYKLIPEKSKVTLIPEPEPVAAAPQDPGEKPASDEKAAEEGDDDKAGDDSSEKAEDGEDAEGDSSEKAADDDEE